MGIVYRAQHVELERTVALKILRPEACGSSKLAQMIRQEAKNASRIGSEFIAEVYDLGSLSDGRVWFTMPLLQGLSLREVVTEGPLAPGRAIGIFRQIAKALASAHGNDLIHRDIKPENVMLVRDRGRDDAVRVLDWGVAAIRDDAEQGRGSVAGTPYYIAPELLLRIPYDHRVDLYSFGCMAFELLTGRPPFQAPTLEELMSAHVEQPPPTMAEVGSPGIPAGLERVVRACLVKHPEQRIATAVELEARLCEAQVEARLQSTWDDLPLPDVDHDRRAKLASSMPDPLRRSGVRRRRWAQGLAAAALVATLAVWAWPRATPPPANDDRIETLTHQAHAAAARVAFVYPLANDRDGATAYNRVRELEALSLPEAQQRALALREEFATTLVRLGDRYWHRPGGRTFALDYYFEALVFVPEHPDATAKMGASPGALAELRSKAETGRFTQAELDAVAPLVALAQPDPEVRAQQLDALQQSDDVRSSTAAALATLADGDPQLVEARKRRRTRRPPVAVEPAAPPTPSPDVEVPVEAPSTEPVEPAPEIPSTEASRDRAAATALVGKADAALQAGRLDAAEGLYQQALAADDRTAAAHAGQSRIAFHRGNYATAVRHAKRAVRHAPRSGKYRMTLGDAFYKSYRYDEAVEQFTRAVKLGHPGARERLDKAKAKATAG